MRRINFIPLRRLKSVKLSLRDLICPIIQNTVQLVQSNQIYAVNHHYLKAIPIVQMCPHLTQTNPPDILKADFVFSLAVSGMLYLNLFANKSQISISKCLLSTYLSLLLSFFFLSTYLSLSLSFFFWLVRICFLITLIKDSWQKFNSERNIYKTVNLTTLF